MMTESMRSEDYQRRSETLAGRGRKKYHLQSSESPEGRQKRQANCYAS